MMKPISALLSSAIRSYGGGRVARSPPLGVCPVGFDPDRLDIQVFLDVQLNRNRSAGRGGGHDRAAESEIGDLSDEPVGLILG
jgi:hypothetical protein